ncbi:MAG: MFS transporter [Thermomicrobiales bacterium]
MVHLVVNLNEELGYSLQTAALVVALMTLLQTAGQLGGGFLGDRYNKQVILTLTMLGHGTAIIVLAFATNYLMVLFFAVVHGIAWGVRGPVLHSYRADCFGRASFAQVLGFLVDDRDVRDDRRAARSRDSGRPHRDYQWPSSSSASSPVSARSSSPSPPSRRRPRNSRSK